MGLWPKRASELMTPVRSEAPAPEARSVPAGVRSLPGYIDAGETADLWPMRVPAFSRGVRLISGTVAQLPLMQWPRENRTPLLAQPEPDRPYWVTMQRTVQDMILYGRAWWMVLAVDSYGYPVSVRWVPETEVTTDTANRTAVVYGVERRLSDPNTPGTTVGSMIRFDGFKSGILRSGRDVLWTSLLLETAAGNYAESPQPTQVLKNTSQYELSDDEIDALLTTYKDSRQESAVAYINGGLDLATFGYSPVDQQLVEARNQSAIQVARLLNLDPFWVGAGVPGSALTYQNRLDMRTDLVDLTLTDYILPIEQRLSMNDVTPTKYVKSVRFDTSEFLRANMDQRATIAISLYTSGVITLDEARAFVSEEQTGGIA